MEWDKITDNWAKMTLRLRNDGKDSGPSQQGRPMTALSNGSGAPTRPQSAPGIGQPETTSVKTTDNTHDLTPQK